MKLDPIALAVATLLGLLVVAMTVLALDGKTIPDVFALLAPTLAGALVARMLPGAAPVTDSAASGRRGPGDTGARL
ncbi:hypothetical protein [Pimelobacter simplex]|uniref:hypothetical protein n=1 Tax=Nocardioides simplex TaxID=2045 RepID=UPI001375A58E|nr:hypothetical protein [Pimelobacter simplex]